MPWCQQPGCGAELSEARPGLPCAGLGQFPPVPASSRRFRLVPAGCTTAPPQGTAGPSAGGSTSAEGHLTKGKSTTQAERGMRGSEENRGSRGGGGGGRGVGKGVLRQPGQRLLCVLRGEVFPEGPVPSEHPQGKGSGKGVSISLCFLLPKPILLAVLTLRRVCFAYEGNWWVIFNSIHKLIQLFFFPCPLKERDWESGWVHLAAR